VQRPPLVIEPLELMSDAGPLRGYLARVDLSNPRVQLRVTPPVPDAVPGKVEARLRQTDAFASALVASLPQPPEAVVAINCNFYSNEGGSKNYKPGVPADILGLSVSSGTVVSPPREFAGQGDPALLVSAQPDGSLRARIARTTDIAIAADPTIRFAVAGIGASESDAAAGTALLTAGFNTASSSRVSSDARHPRTAVGVADGGRTLVIIVIDGRQNDWSVGITLPELATLFLRQGCTDAVNLDGGGSTAFVAFDAAGTRTSNRPSGGVHRPVANHLAVILTKPH
jgi:exopolysaccharide biosynthesis protein